MHVHWHITCQYYNISYYIRECNIWFVEGRVEYKLSSLTNLMLRDSLEYNTLTTSHPSGPKAKGLVGCEFLYTMRVYVRAGTYELVHHARVHTYELVHYTSPTSNLFVCQWSPTRLTITVARMSQERITDCHKNTYIGINTLKSSPLIGWKILFIWAGLINQLYHQHQHTLGDHGNMFSR